MWNVMLKMIYLVVPMAKQIIAANEIHDTKMSITFHAECKSYFQCR